MKRYQNYKYSYTNNKRHIDQLNIRKQLINYVYKTVEISKYKYKIQNTYLLADRFWLFDNLNFDIVSNFDIRILDLF